MRGRKKSDYAESVTQMITSRNHVSMSKPLAKVWIIFLNIVVTILFIWAFFNSSNITVNQATILGIAGSTCISIMVLVVTLNREKRKDYIEARKAARVLSQILKSVYFQIERLKTLPPISIVYPPNWLEYYAQCSMYLKYDYLEYLMQEFEIIEGINASITGRDFDRMRSLINYRDRTITDWTSDFNILSVQCNLSMFSLGSNEFKPWKQEKDYIEFNKYFVDKFSSKVIALTVEYLEMHDGHCDVNSAEYYVLERIREDEELKTGKYYLKAYENKALLKAIFQIYLSLVDGDEVSLCWGELSLKECNDS